MYLSARKYIGNWPHSTKGEKAAYAKVMQAVGVDASVSPEWSPHLFVEICVAYWRKANAIHGWFVSNCQDGRDDCQPYHGSREQLEQLLRDCNEAIKEREKGNAGGGGAKLPPTAGFFFGDTICGADYWITIENTVEQLQGILSNKSLRGFEFCYRSSW